jgi:hypothetical protein
MRKFKEEFSFPLDKVERKWLRRSAVILLTVSIVIAGAITGVYVSLKDFYRLCW